MNIPWDDCKVAFRYNGQTDIDDIWDAIPKESLPNGWELNETDCSGARCVVIFRVNGTLNATDGQSVRELLDNL